MKTLADSIASHSHALSSALSLSSHSHVLSSDLSLSQVPPKLSLSLSPLTPSPTREHNVLWRCVCCRLYCEVATTKPGYLNICCEHMERLSELTHFLCALQTQIPRALAYARDDLCPWISAFTSGLRSHGHRL
ncbi:hypothetical protein KP509_01G091700 [Ceratopteris richardii]|uniref:Uncharacterized protein n=1 Tax=Ceratopteris richardii TaxID=49495 RepID=A0A8T2VIG6_CERRI|nr:hypothetical protein KP509_01G091700 [Ceratopteris richardii]